MKKAAVLRVAKSLRLTADFCFVHSAEVILVVLCLQRLMLVYLKINAVMLLWSPAE